MARMTHLPGDVQYLIFIYLGRAEHLSLSRTHRAFKYEAQRLLFRTTVLLPVQSAGARLRSENGSLDRNVDNSQDTTYLPVSRRPPGKDFSDTLPFELPMDREKLISSSEANYENALAQGRHVEQFLCAITINPGLATFVHCLRLHATWGALRVFHTNILEVIERLPNIRSVSLTMFDYIKGRNWEKVQHSCIEWLCQLIEKTSVKNVQTATFCRPFISKVIQIRRVESIEYHGKSNSMDDFTHFEMEKYRHWIEDAPLPNLKEIRFGLIDLHHKTLTRICTQATELTHLSACFGYHSRNINRIAVSLGMAKGSLQSLELFEPLQFSVPTSNDAVSSYGHIDFSHFQRLRKLRISSLLWFNRSRHFPDAPEKGFFWECEDRIGTHKLLPASIEHIQIQFGSHSDNVSGVFGLGPAFKRQFHYLSAPRQLASYNWILEFIQHRDRLPRLKSLSLIEGIPGDADGHFSLDIFDSYQPPKEVQDTFNEAGVDLEVQLVSFST